ARLAGGVGSVGIVVYGTGSWGTTLAVVQAMAGRPVGLLTRTETEAQRLRRDHENRRHLPGVRFPESLEVTADTSWALREAALLILAVPSQTLRAGAAALRLDLGEDCLIVSAAKGLEIGSGRRMSEVLVEELGR